MKSALVFGVICASTFALALPFIAWRPEKGRHPGPGAANGPKEELSEEPSPSELATQSDPNRVSEREQTERAQEELKKRLKDQTEAQARTKPPPDPAPTERKQGFKDLVTVGTRLDISGRTTDGELFDLRNLKGKIVLVDFWATWCGPCVAEIPNIIKANEKYGSRGFVVIGVSLDRNNEAITKFANFRKLPWSCINVQDSRKLVERYGVKAIPQPILIGRDGLVVSMRARGAELERLLARLISDRPQGGRT